MTLPYLGFDPQAVVADAIARGWIRPPTSPDHATSIRAGTARIWDGTEIKPFPQRTHEEHLAFKRSIQQRRRALERGESIEGYPPIVRKRTRA